MFQQPKPPPMIRPAGYSDDDDDSDDDGMDFDMPTLTKRRPQKTLPSTNTPCNGSDGRSNSYDNDENEESWAAAEDWGTSTNFNVKEQDLGTLGSEEARIACCKGDLEKVKIYLEQDESNINAYFLDDHTPLLTAAGHGHPDLVKYLLSKGADVKINSRGHRITALISAVYCTYHRNESEVLECVKILIEAGALVNTQDQYGMFPLLITIQRGNDRRKVAEYLLDHGADSNLRDQTGRTCIFFAAEVGDGKSCRLLLEKGADIHIIDDSGWSSADVASDKGFHRLTELLYKARYSKWKPGSDPNLMHEIDEESQKSKANPSADGVTIREDSQIELLLSSMQADKYMENFRKNRVTYVQFLLFDEEDFKELGIVEIGIRKKLLDAIREIHNTEWMKPSLKRVPVNRKVTAAETVCIINNIKGHIEHIYTTLMSTRMRIQKDPLSLQLGKERHKIQDIVHLCKELDKNNLIMEKEVIEFQHFIESIQANPAFEIVDGYKPPDSREFMAPWDKLKEKKKSKTEILWDKKLIIGGGVVSVLVGCVLAYKML